MKIYKGTSLRKRKPFFIIKVKNLNPPPNFFYYQEYAILTSYRFPCIYCNRIYPDDKTGLGNLSRYIIRACFSQGRMIYVPVEKSTDGIAKVVYSSKDGKSRKFFNSLDWIYIKEKYELDYSHGELRALGEMLGTEYACSLY